MLAAQISLPSAVLRSIDLKLLGSGFGSVSKKHLLQGIRELFETAAAGKLTTEIEVVPLTEVESAWNRSEQGRRIVFTI